MRAASTAHVHRQFQAEHLSKIHTLFLARAHLTIVFSVRCFEEKTKKNYSIMDWICDLTAAVQLKMALK